jgi:hypothetical protein
MVRKDVKKLEAADNRLAVDELQQEMSIISFKSRKVWNQVFNNNTSTCETLHSSFGDKS